LGLHNDAANARSEYSGAGVGKGGVRVGAGRASHLHGQTCPKFCHIFWLISKMQIIDVLADIGARPVAFSLCHPAKPVPADVDRYVFHGHGGGRSFVCSLFA